ncbi:MAG: hypothetical protein JXN61_01370 [Sedimentisphaerales bacterium]|nr:hypothetical protein [Sedimentisphaerales bacterium]
MAKLTFTLEELIGILIGKKLLPGEIVRLKVKGQRIHFVIKTGAFILPFVPASLGFSSFDGNNAVFELTMVSSHLSRAKSLFSDLIKPMLPQCMELDYPRISVDVNKLLAEKGIKAVRVKDMFFENENFAVLTCSIQS